MNKIDRFFTSFLRSDSLVRKTPSIAIKSNKDSIKFHKSSISIATWHTALSVPFYFSVVEGNKNKNLQVSWRCCYPTENAITCVCVCAESEKASPWLFTISNMCVMRFKCYASPSIVSLSPIASGNSLLLWKGRGRWQRRRWWWRCRA